MGIWWLTVLVICMASAITGADYREFDREALERDYSPDYTDLTDTESDLALRHYIYNILGVQRQRKRAASCLGAHSLDQLCTNLIAFNNPDFGPKTPGRRRRAALDVPSN